MLCLFEGDPSPRQVGFSRSKVDGLKASFHLPSRELTYPIKNHVWRWFSFPKVGYVNSLEGICFQKILPRNPTSYILQWRNNIHRFSLFISLEPIVLKQKEHRVIPGNTHGFSAKWNPQTKTNFQFPPWEEGVHWKVSTWIFEASDLIFHEI